MALRRVLLKLSGEALKENGDLILSAGALTHMAEMIKAIIDSGVQVCVVVGAGNIWPAKLQAMLAWNASGGLYGVMGAVINAVVASKLKDLGTSSIVTSAILQLKELLFLTWSKSLIRP